MIRTIGDARERFDAIVAENAEWPDALAELLAAGFELSEMDVLRRRVLLAEHGRIAEHRDLLREEAAREGARAAKRELEGAWSGFLERGMREGHLPTGDPRPWRGRFSASTTAWSWYRPGGR